jgi:hypothetical protein
VLAAAASPGGQQLVVAWPGWASGYTLYSASNLQAPVQWSSVTNSPQTSNSVLYLSLPTTNGPQQYFRLGSP